MQAKIEVLDLTKIAAGTMIHVQTRNTLYVIEMRHDDILISGNKTYCPEPTPCSRLGSGWWYGDIHEGRLCLEEHMRFLIEGEGLIITTPIQSIEVVSA